MRKGGEIKEGWEIREKQKGRVDGASGGGEWRLTALQDTQLTHQLDGTWWFQGSI